MRAYKIACLAAVASIAYASGAHAASISPGGSSFSMVGSVKFVKGIQTLTCAAAFYGTIDASRSFATITSATFSGGPLSSCLLVTATNLPWTITAPDTTHVTISSAGFNTPIGNCSPNQLNANWMNNSSASTMSFINQPVGFDCLVTVSLKVPGVTVEPI